ncbi:hypothetical protein F4803DRAFT_563528 [Xylaria telfairii]|nr:hypothetical protein F4803DRAFT_563528 [Xylaria telfairii]
MDEVMADDELLSFTDSDSETYSSEEEVGDSLVLQEEAGGFVSDAEDMDLVSDKGSIDSVSSEEEEEEYGTIRPKIPFKQRCDPLVRPNHEKFQKIENYFFSLLRAPGITVDDILQGTFDDHEITLITPQSGPPDIVEWQRRNARRYYENLETRLKGGNDTLAFKMTCLYFGFPVEPLRMGTMPFLLPPDPDPLDAKKATLKADPLAFLDKYDDQEKFNYDKNIISLRGGGVSAWATLNPGKEYDPANPPIIGFDASMPKTIPIAEGKKTKGKQVAKGKQAAKGIEQPAKQQEPAAAAKSLHGPTHLKKTHPCPPNKPEPPVAHIRIYGWQGSVMTSLDYNDNWDPVDRSLCVEIWRKAPLELVKTALGRLRHGLKDAYVSDEVWRLIKRYFGQGDDGKYACFVRIGDEPQPTDPKRPGGYEPPSTEGVIRIALPGETEVAYMRVPKRLRKGHKPHQFSMEYMLALQALFFDNGPHAWVSFRKDDIANTYQYLDPPGQLWTDIINGHIMWKQNPTVSLSLESIDHAVVPVIVPGNFTSKLPGLKRKDFRLTSTAKNVTGLKKVYEAVRLSLKSVDLKKECSGLEIWCPGANFKSIHQRPAHITFSGDIANLTSLHDWQRLLGSGVVPDEGFALVVRPVYKVYHLRGIDDGNNIVDLQINGYDIARFQAFVRARIYGNYDSGDPSLVLTLSSANQPKLLIQHNTTEEQWQWILRNITQPDIDLSLEDADDEWLIPETMRWGPRYTTRNNPSLTSTKGDKPATNPSSAGDCATCGHGVSGDGGSGNGGSGDGGSGDGGSGDGGPGDGGPGNGGSGNGGLGQTGSSPYKNDESLNDVFKDSKNTIDEATRAQLLRDRTFTSVNSIFTNPLKPVMPLNGPPLESILRTGPSMPGVSIAMMTPTEVLRLQREVHSLRFQLLDRTRECPYADCDRYFTFADTVGLDKHVREDHNVLRCFLCDKDKHLLPYYNTDQIKEHFVKEHVDDILKAYGQTGKAGAGGSSDQYVANTGKTVPAATSTTNTTTPAKPKNNTATPAKPTNRKKVPVKDPKTEPNFDIFTAVQASYTNDADSRKWIKAALERHIADGGETMFAHGSKEAAFEALRKVSEKPGTFEENMAFIKGQLDEYVAKGGKPPLSSQNGAAQRARVSDADDSEDNAAARKRKRRDSSSSGSEPYEYSERSAVSDSPANLAPDAPRSAKKQRKGRAAKASRAVAEVAEVSSSDSSSSSSLSSLPSFLSAPSSSSDSSSEGSGFD